MLVDDAALLHARVHVGHANQHANATVGQLLGPLDLVEILRGVVVDRGPEQTAQVGKAVAAGAAGCAWIAASSVSVPAGKSG